MRFTLTLAFGLLLASHIALAESFRATLYEQGGGKSKVLFTQTHDEILEGNLLKSIRRAYKGTDGADLAIEDVTFEGGKVKSLKLNHMQVNEQGTLEVAGGRVQFTYTAGGKTKTDSESLPEDLVVSATVIPDLHARWDALLKGDTLKMRLAVLDRLETIGFQLRQTGTGQLNGKPTVEVEMKPSNFVIAALVKPVRMVYERESKRLVDYSGRVLPKKQAGGKWEPLDADGSYTY
jgi:hypothetical protein